MPQNWKTYKLSEITDIITKGTTPSTYGFSFVDAGVNYIKSDSTSYDGILDENVFVKVSIDAHEKLKRSQLKENDILYSIAGAYLGKSGIVRQNHLPANTNQANAIIRIDSNKADFIFVSLVLRNPALIEYVNASSGQSAQPNLNLTDLGNLDISLPPLPEQKAIAQILSGIDDKIENNLAINKTLEEMAMALYKHWFVDFGPFQDGAFVESELGEIPEGWEVNEIRDLFAIKPINGLYKKKEFQGFGSRWLKMKSVYGIDIITDEEMELIDVNEIEIEKYGCKRNDLVFGRTSLVLEGIGTCAIIKSDDNIPVFESNLFRYRFNENLVSPDLMFLYFKSPLGREEVKKLARQTAAVSITSSDVSKIKIALPNKIKQMEISSEIESFLEQIVFNKEENQTLTQLRDTLLPKLISGEVRLKEFEEEIESAV